MKIYFDTCCYNRPYDNQKQSRIRAESSAIKNIIALAQWNGYTILGSKALDNEISGIKNPVKHRAVARLYKQTITSRSPAKKAVFNHFAPMAILAGIDRLDAIHLCFSISAGADYLLSTDDGFINIASGLTIPVKVINPLNFPLGGVI